MTSAFRFTPFNSSFTLLIDIESNSVYPIPYPGTISMIASGVLASMGCIERYLVDVLGVGVALELLLLPNCVWVSCLFLIYSVSARTWYNLVFQWAVLIHVLIYQ